MPALYRKKPLLVSAHRWKPDDLYEVGVMMGWFYSTGFRDFYIYSDKSISIKTPEGKMRVQPGDWVIQGVKGEFYPCKDDIFKQTYDLEGASDGTHHHLP